MKKSQAMEKTISSQDAPGRFGGLLQEVSDKGDRYVVERDGVLMTAVVPFVEVSDVLKVAICWTAKLLR